MYGTYQGTRQVPLEWSIAAERPSGNAFADVEVVVVVQKEGEMWDIPAFWSGDNEWTVRFAPPEPGRYSWHSTCGGTSHAALRESRGEITVQE